MSMPERDPFSVLPTSQDAVVWIVMHDNHLVDAFETEDEAYAFIRELRDMTDAGRLEKGVAYRSGHCLVERIQAPVSKWTRYAVFCQHRPYLRLFVHATDAIATIDQSGENE